MFIHATNKLLTLRNVLLEQYIMRMVDCLKKSLIFETTESVLNDNCSILLS